MYPYPLTVKKPDRRNTRSESIRKLRKERGNKWYFDTNTYTCETCGRIFQRKFRYDAHLQKPCHKPSNYGWGHGRDPIRMFGENNPTKRPEVRNQIKEIITANYKKGKSMGFVSVKGLSKKSLQPDYTQPIEPVICNECSETTNLILHHVDGNQNNSLHTNLQWLCGSCHTSKQYQPYMVIGVSVNFSSAHLIEGHKGKCSNLHGHNFKLTVKLGGRLNKLMMVRDFGEVKPILEETVSMLDHKYLNEVFEFNIMTSEWILIQLFKTLNHKLKGLKEISLSEGDNTISTLTDAYFQEFLGHRQSRKIGSKLSHFAYKTVVWKDSDCRLEYHND